MAFISLACLIVGICLMTSPGHIANSSPSIEELQEVSVSKEEEEPPKPKLFEWSFILILCHLFFVSLGTQFPLYYIQLYAERHGVSQELAFYSIAITNIAGLFGRLIPNHLADRYGCLDVYLPCITLNGEHFCFLHRSIFVLTCFTVERHSRVCHAGCRNTHRTCLLLRDVSQIFTRLTL